MIYLPLLVVLLLEFVELIQGRNIKYYSTDKGDELSLDNYPICRDLYNNDDNWSQWGECSAKCGEGVQYSTLGNTVQGAISIHKCEIIHRSRACNGYECPVDCEVSAFGSFGPCDQSSGKRLRERNITVAPLYDGIQCPPLIDTVDCTVDCQLTDFSDWSTCDIDTRVRTRKRNIINPPLNGGEDCGPLVETEDCDQYCRSIPWSNYSDCNVSTGLMTRTRTINNKNKDKGCKTIDEIPCPVDCQLGPWTPDPNIEPVCNNLTGTYTRKREIVVESKNNGVDCNSVLHDTHTIETFPCKVDCQVTGWSRWTDCDPTTAMRVRTRSIFMNALNGGADCPDLKEQEDCAVHCAVGGWGEYGECDSETGFKNRTRPVLIEPKNGGIPCVTIEEIPCPVDAQVGPWGPFSDCQVSGDFAGTQTRTREVVIEAKNGGDPPPHLQDTRLCSLECKYQIIGNWSSCDVFTGTRKRSREALYTPGSLVKCPNFEIEPCPVNCLVTPFSNWTKCHDSTDIRTRNRSVIFPPMNGGNQCPHLSEEQDCVEDCASLTWSDYSKCSPVNGTYYRTRDTSLLMTSADSDECSDIEFADCEVSCEVTDWSLWSVCIQMGPNKGTQSRHRQILVNPLNGGADCPALNETRDCDVDCVTSEWTDYGSCIQGVRRRQRDVLIPPVNAGKQCPPLVDSIDCDDTCVTTPWTNYTTCDQDNGQQIRTREIISGDPDKCITTETITCPVGCITSNFVSEGCNEDTGIETFNRSILVKPLNGGADCPSLFTERPCPVDCIPGDWEQTPCDENGDSIMYRTIIREAMNGGSNDGCDIIILKQCPVDCIIDPSDGTVIRESLNSGKSCFDVALDMQISGIDIDPFQYSGTGTILATNMYSKFKNTLDYNSTLELALAILACTIIIVSAVVIIRSFMHRPNGYSRISSYHRGNYHV